jgi:hypothetical protein
MKNEINNTIKFNILADRDFIFKLPLHFVFHFPKRLVKIMAISCET